MAKNKTTTKKSSGKKSKKVTRAKRTNVETNSMFFLKLVIFLILGSQWVYIQSGDNWQIPLPVGLIIGLVFATHEHFIIDKKIEYLMLLLAAFVAFWLPIGLVIKV